MEFIRFLQIFELIAWPIILIGIFLMIAMSFFFIKMCVEEGVKKIRHKER